jgi:phenylalanyl-tRNA synthetase beta chain
MLGIEVESITDYGKKYENFFTAKVLSKDKLPDTDKLSICKVFDGIAERIVICGAPNVETGQIVVLGIPGAIVPQNNSVIEEKVIRKVSSSGMLCSRYELEFGDDHSGIWVLPPDAKIGVSLADYLNLNDIVFDISVTPNRADCLSHLGIAREIAAFSKKKIKKPVITIKESNSPIQNSISVIIEDPDKCPRYTARVVREVKVKESPDWLKNRLTILGLRPINVIVDVTNLILLECGQPLHAFDLDYIEGNKIIVKTAVDGAKFITLDNKERTLDSDMLMICDGKKPVAIGGVMGGENSEINSSTKNILIESAFFSPRSIRSTSKKLGIQSEASYRFERGVDIDNVIYALNRATQLIAELSGGIVEKGVIDVYPQPRSNLRCDLRFHRTNDIIGLELSSKQIKDMLESLDFKIIKETVQSILVEVPLYRVDIEGEIDLIEEIARLYNYDNISPQFSSSIDFSSGKVPDELAVPKFREQLTDYLVQNGYHQVITQNMIDPASAKLFTDDPIQISNPLGEELSILRPSLVPSILKTIEHNLRMGTTDLKLFEIGRTFHKVENSQKTFIEGILEKEVLLIAHAGSSHPIQWGLEDKQTDFYDIKGIIEDIFSFFHLSEIILQKENNPGIVYSGNCLSVSMSGKIVGNFGEVSEKLLKKYGIEIPVYFVILELTNLYSKKRTKQEYNSVSQYPGINRDLAFVVDNNISFENIYEEIKNNGGELLQNINLFDVYSGKSIGENKKSLAFSLYYSSPERTLQDVEVDSSINNIIKTVEHNLGAKLRSF